MALPTRLIVTTVRAALALVAIAAFGIGIPFAWVWIGSQFQGGTAPSSAGLGVTLGGIVGSYVLLAILFGWVKGRSSQAPTGPVRYAWNRSLSAERYQAGRGTTPLEDIIAVATIVVGIICTFWFFAFGSPGVPTTP
jgi:hypothetical protein